VKEELPADEYIVPIGQAAIRRTGTDLTIVTFGAMVHTALAAAERLERDGIQIEIIDLRTLMPFDRDTIVNSVAKTNKVILLHEASRTGGIGAELAAVIAEAAFEHLDGPVVRVTSLDTPVPFSPLLEQAFMPTTDKVVAAVKTLVTY
jgi:2-oxoisovalerate dehydrogenase E1 component beta subunit